MNMKIMSVNNQSITNQPQKAPTFKGEANIVRGAEYLSKEATERLIKQYKDICPATTKFDFDLYRWDRILDGDFREGDVLEHITMKVKMTDKDGKVTEYDQNHCESIGNSISNIFENLIGGLGKLLKAVQDNNNI